ncbi:putative E3 ubiquitin-protein ligase HTD2 [Apophysomyces sp. BC1034]|nr:putative E3 ubiquitin-protein ligase HTD2 [Apophysomyces sp. BC1015]KAG0183289.1 putative E3 ubiquitin-protein ligase HTD2 [Apophysomyces sp. BC1021]KAG0194023.1 putative E3 ubiquitin-protein ligase HTD2 [Apophysomyces sp. BC1034]
MSTSTKDSINKLTPATRVDCIDYESIDALVTECKESNAWSPLEDRLLAVFSDIHALSASFIRKSDGPYRLCPVDKQQAHMAFELLQSECPSYVTEQLERRSRNLLRYCVRNSKEKIGIQHLNMLVIMFQCPTFVNPFYLNGILIDLCEFAANLNDYLQDMLCRYLVESTEPSLAASEFEHILLLFQQLIRDLVTRSEMSPNSNPSIIDATRCLAMMYRLNERRHYVSYTEFYNDELNERLEIKEDFPNFKDHKGFSFCDYPFILNPAIKADILKIESVFQMRHELQDAFFRALFQGVNSPYLVLEIRRDHIISDALQQLEEKSVHDLKKQLRVQFVGEEGVDEGGVQKEFFQLIVRELFDPKYGMFTFNDESRLCWFSSNPAVDDYTIREYKLVGLLLGLAVYNSVILDLHFPLALYKQLMNIDISLPDLEQLDPGLGKGLRQLLTFSGNVESEYDRSFQVDLESCGHVYTFDLKSMGSTIQLTNENREEFVDLYTKFMLYKSVEKQLLAFQEGFRLVCQDSAIKIFRPEEIEQLICGSSDLDFEALERSTVYDGGWTKDSFIIKYFWEIVHSFSSEEKKKLLFFATGSDRAPIGGLSKLQFVIAKNGGDSDRLPTSHTCYNVLLLCEYSSKQKLRERLLTSISNSEGFGMI